MKLTKPTDCTVPLALNITTTLPYKSSSAQSRARIIANASA